MKIPSKSLEKKLFKNGYRTVVGVDEVGMGCLAGPVVVCAVSIAPDFYLKPQPDFKGLTDSKLLSPYKRNKYFYLLKNHPHVQWAIASSTSVLIDKINILQASHLAMKRAVSTLIKDSRNSIHESKTLNRKSRSIVLVDGNKKIAGLAHHQMPIIKGDQNVFAIACASVMAKVYRDRLMSRYAKKYPGYGFEIHKGYGTSLHRQRIKELGRTPLHRLTFNVK